MTDLYSVSEQNDLENSESISLLEIVLRFARYWKWFVLGIVLALAGVFLYLRYTTPVYNITSSIVLKEARDQRMEPSISGMDGIQLGGLGAVANLENEIYILQSRSIIRNVINRLNLHTSYVVSGRIKSNDLYKRSPVIVSMDQGNLDKLTQNISFNMTTNESDGTITISGLEN
jgi:tyrosine-protein kinase Etk/Wzc